MSLSKDVIVSVHFFVIVYDRELLLTRKILNQGFILAKLKSSLRKFYAATMYLVDVMEYLCHK